jgi:hypothetical protein
MKGSLAALVVLAAGIGSAGAEPALARLEAKLPAGWSLLSTDTELVLRHDRPCYAATAGGEGPLVTLELRYRLEPAWSDRQLADAKAANAKLAAEHKALRARYRIDAIRVVKGEPQPQTADERSRLAAYKMGLAAAGRPVALPQCTLDDRSVFDDGAAALQRRVVEPPEANVEAASVFRLMQACDKL